MSTYTGFGKQDTVVAPTRPRRHPGPGGPSPGTVLIAVAQEIVARFDAARDELGPEGLNLRASDWLRELQENE